MPPTRNQLGTIIREARQAKGLTSKDAAEKLGIDAGYYSRIESGQYAVGKYARPIAKLYKLNADELEAMATNTLPKLRPYLRAKFDLPDEAIAELEAHFAAVTKKHAPKRRGRS